MESKTKKWPSGYFVTIRILGLNLPSLWYEMQITTPTFNVYGVSFPGAPAIIIGFNEHIAWGVTNAARDVRIITVFNLGTGLNLNIYIITNGKILSLLLKNIK